MNNNNFPQNKNEVDTISETPFIPPGETLGGKGNEKPFTEAKTTFVDNKTVRLDTAKSKILRYGTSEYNTAIKANKDLPTVERFLSGGNQVVDLVATMHDTDPDSQQMERLDGAFADFLVHTPNAEDRLVLFEGLPVEGDSFDAKVKNCEEVVDTLFNEHRVQTSSDAVRLFGEMGYVTFRAREHGVQILSPEVTTEPIAVKLQEERFPDVRVAAFFTARTLDAYQHRGQHVDEQHYTLQETFDALTTVSEQTGWRKEEALKAKLQLEDEASGDGAAVMEAFVNQVSNELNQESQRIVGSPLIGENYAWGMDTREVQNEEYNRIFNPSGETEFNQVAKRVNELRDDFIVETIDEAVTGKGKSLFIAFGSGHATTIQPALEELYSKVG